MALLSIIFLLLISSFTFQISPSSCTQVVGDGGALPPNFARRLSPLSSTAVSRFTAYLKDGSLAQDRSEFCDAAGIMCRDGYKPTFVQPYRNIYWAGHNKIPTRRDATTQAIIRDVQAKHIYFREEALVGGGQLFVNSLANPVPPRPFLPKAIASRLPFSTSTLPDLTQMLGIPSNSYLSKSMALSLEQCETQRIGENKMCATSAEDMLQFATSVLGPNNAQRIQILSTDAGSSVFPQTPTFQEVTVKVPAEKTSIVCHDVMFPFAVYSCHQIPDTKVYEATWTTKEGKLVRAAAVCHMKTKGFDATHPAFAALNMKPGDGEVCHWVDEENLVIWVDDI